MRTIVSKFGGSSLADAQQFCKVADIIKSDVARRYVVASAPGKRCSDDVKVTDLLYHCYDAAMENGEFDELLQQIQNRYLEIIEHLGISFDLEREMALIRAHLLKAPQRDYLASRGEYLNAKILATFLNYDFLDAADVVRFTDDGSFDAELTNKMLSEALANRERAVLPGFYGTLPTGEVHTFSRGGSDVTGALVARAVQADLYENWTDVSGMLAADPRIVERPRVIEYISYQELRELSYMGASVLHEDAVFPVRKAGIPINIRNTNSPKDCGTFIMAALPKVTRPGPVTGIAGKKDFVSVQVEKSMMNTEVGFGAKLLAIFARHGIPFEHCPTGIDSISVIVSNEQFHLKREIILQEIREQLSPDILTVEDGLAMIAVVGHGIAYAQNIALQVFQALAEAEIDVWMIDQGSSKLNIILGIAQEDYERAIRSIYQKCID